MKPEHIRQVRGLVATWDKKRNSKKPQKWASGFYILPWWAQRAIALIEFRGMTPEEAVEYIGGKWANLKALKDHMKTVDGRSWIKHCREYKKNATPEQAAGMVQVQGLLECTETEFWAMDVAKAMNRPELAAAISHRIQLRHLESKKQDTTANAPQLQVVINLPAGAVLDIPHGESDFKKLEPAKEAEYEIDD